MAEIFFFSGFLGFLFLCPILVFRFLISWHFFICSGFCLKNSWSFSTLSKTNQFFPNQTNKVTQFQKVWLNMTKKLESILPKSSVINKLREIENKSGKIQKEFVSNKIIFYHDFCCLLFFRSLNILGIWTLVKCLITTVKSSKLMSLKSLKLCLMEMSSC